VGGYAPKTTLYVPKILPSLTGDLENEVKQEQISTIQQIIVQSL